MDADERGALERPLLVRQHASQVPALVVKVDDEIARARIARAGVAC
jgi:hypothetical protein